MKVKDIMSKSVVTVGADASAEAAARLMRDRNVGSLVVIEKGMPVGIVTERDLITKALAENKKPSDVILRNIMSAPLITIDAEKSVSEAIELMKEKGVRRLPVLEGGRQLVGIVTVREPFVRRFYPERACVSAPLLEEVEDLLLTAERLLGRVGEALSRGAPPDEYYREYLDVIREAYREMKGLVVRYDDDEEFYKIFRGVRELYVESELGDFKLKREREILRRILEDLRKLITRRRAGEAS